MKNLTKVLVAFLISLLCYQTNAQTFGIEGGYNLANMLQKDNDMVYSEDFISNPGFHFGFNVNVPLNNFLSFEPGLILTTKGLKFEQQISGGFEELVNVNLTTKASLYYLDMPLKLKATHDWGKFKTYGAFGPYVGVGLSGKRMTTAETGGEEETEEESVNFGNDEDNDDLKRFDMGLTFGGGVEIKSITIGASYDLGLYNPSLIQDNGATVSNRTWRFSLGYRF